MEPLGNSSPTPNQHPPLLYAQSSLTFSLLATSRYCFSPPITCVLQEVNTHQQPTQKLPLCGINSSLYYVRPGSVWTAKVCRLLLRINIWALTNGSGWPMQLQHLSSLVRMENEQAPLCQPQITYLNTWWNRESDLLELGFRYYVQTNVFSTQSHCALWINGSQFNQSKYQQIK